MGRYLSFLLTGKPHAVAAAYFDAIDAGVAARSEYVKSLGGKPEYMAYRDGQLAAVAFDQLPGKGWKPSKRHEGFHVPDCRTSIGKKTQQRFNSFRKPKMPDELLEALEVAGYPLDNIQPLPYQHDGSGALLVNAHLARIGKQLFLRCPDPEFNREGDPQPDPAKLPEGITAVPHSEFIAACEREGMKVA